MDQTAVVSIPQRNRDLANCIVDRIRNDRSIRDEAISVDVIDGHAILRGSVSRYAAMVAACAVAKETKGVSSVRSELTVEIPENLSRTDAEIRDAAQAALRWQGCLRQGMVNTCVQGGEITLTGQVDWSYQKKLAEQVLEPLQGITSIRNFLTVSDRQLEMEILSRIRAALRVAAETQADAIEVEAQQGTVTLRGITPGMNARTIMCAAARGHPEVRELHDELRERR